MTRSIFSPTFLLVLAIAASLLLSACSEGQSDGAGNKKGRPGGNRPATKPIPVEVLNPEIGLAASYYVTTATLTPSSDANINARTAGVVRQILHEEGDDVKAGDVLLLLEDDDQKLRLKQAQQNLASSEREFKRLSKMKSAGAVSPNEWETANNNFQTAKTEVELAELALSYTRVAAPFDGRVVWREIDLGAHVSNGDLLFRMMAIDPLLIRVHVPANRIGKVAKGQTVDLTVDSVPQALQAVVELVSPIVDPATGTVKVTLKLEKYPAGVRPGDFTEIRMVTDQREDAMLLPSVAIIEERGQHYLFVESDNKAQRKEIQVGYVIGDKTEVTAGISLSDRVVVKGQRNLKDGNQLKIIGSENSQQRLQQASQSLEKLDKQSGES